MTDVALEDLIRARFDSQWADETDIAWPNANFTPDNNSEWVRFWVGTGDAYNASFGAVGKNIERAVGVVTISIFVPLNTGTARVNALVDKAKAAFRHYTVGTLRFSQPPAKRVIGSGDTHFQVNVVAPYEYDTFI